MSHSTGEIQTQGIAAPSAYTAIRAQDPTALAPFYADVATRSIDQMAAGRGLVTAEMGRCDDSLIFRESCTAAMQTWGHFRTPSFGCVVTMAPFSGGRYFGQDIVETSVLTLEPGMDFWLVAPEGAEYGGIVMGEAQVMRHATALQLASEEHLREIPRLIDLPMHRVQGLRRFVTTVLANMARNQDVARSPVACAHIQESAAVLLVCAFLGRSRLRGAGRPKASYERIARRARDLVLSRPKEPPTLVELCEHLHVGVRTLNYAFQSAVGTSAGEFVRVVRLNRVREELIEARGGNGVVLSRIASKWGFWHASDFARQYRALFGERPSETLHLNEAPAALPGTRPRRAAATPRTRTARRRTTKSA